MQEKTSKLNGFVGKSVYCPGFICQVLAVPANVYKLVGSCFFFSFYNYFSFILLAYHGNQ